VAASAAEEAAEAVTREDATGADSADESTAMEKVADGNGSDSGTGSRESTKA
jgi:hypothetical protein